MTKIFSRKVQEEVLLAFLAMVLITIAAYIGRPIWIDEIGQFALAAFDSTKEAWQVFLSTAGGMNHGQTGLYYMLNFWSLKIFGASLFWIRFPTYVSSIFLYFAARHLYEQWKLPLRWQIWGYFALFGSPTISYYMSEGRPYEPLAACTLGALAYYYTPIDERNTWRARFIGWTSVIFGGLIHPYFSIYWVFVSIVPYIQNLIEGNSQLSLRGLLEHLNLRLVILGSVAYFGLGAITWLKYPAGYFGYDPFQWFPKEVPLAEQFLRSHFKFIDGGVHIFLFISVFSVVALAGLGSAKKWYPRVVAAQLMVFGGLLLSLLISYISYRHGYWIIHRQWIGSMVLTSVGATYFVYLISQLLNQSASVLWTLVIFGVLGLETATSGYSRLYASQKGVNDFSPMYAVHYMMRPHSPRGRLEKMPDPKSSADFVEMAQENIEEGGPVDPRMKKFYGR